VPQDIGYEKAGNALRPGGSLALFWNVRDQPRDALNTAIERAYREHAPHQSYKAPGGKPGAGDVAAHIQATGLFGPVKTLSYPWTADYDSATWIRMLRTFSDNMTIPETPRERLFAAIQEAIESHGGVYRDHMTTTLYFAHNA
jgi:hypothetical protein